ncbi:MAG: hypothetical protein ABS95_00445 [Verrucomicrobia bacterium SCN 57-15]|nr:MAG: hypothetical protein ABS95_00445 [Verrucomicrobia bacterium SCN 57-15]
MKLIEIYNGLADETRLRIMHLLAQAPLCVCHLQSVLGLTQVAVSKHLAYLRQRGLVEGSRHQQWMIYSLPAKQPRELELQLRALQDCAQLDEVLREDLRRLKNVEPDCCWVEKVLQQARPPMRKPTNASKRSALVTT